MKSACLYQYKIYFLLESIDIPNGLFSVLPILLLTIKADIFNSLALRYIHLLLSPVDETLHLDCQPQQHQREMSVSHTYQATACGHFCLPLFFSCHIECFSFFFTFIPRRVGRITSAEDKVEESSTGAAYSSSTRSSPYPPQIIPIMQSLSAALSGTKLLYHSSPCTPPGLRNEAQKAKRFISDTVPVIRHSSYSVLQHHPSPDENENGGLPMKKCDSNGNLGAVKGFTGSYTPCWSTMTTSLLSLSYMLASILPNSLFCLLYPKTLVFASCATM